MNISTANATRSTDEDAIKDLAEKLSHFQILLGVLTMLMLVAVNALTVCLNEGKLGPISFSKNLLLCALLLSNAVVFFLNSANTTFESHQIRIAVSVASACGKFAYLTFCWVRTREILSFVSYPCVYSFFSYLCMAGQIIVWAPIFVVSFATGPSPTLIRYAVSFVTSLVVVLLDCYFAFVMAKFLVRARAVKPSPAATYSKSGHTKSGHSKSTFSKSALSKSGHTKSAHSKGVLFKGIDSKGTDPSATEVFPIIASHQLVACAVFFTMVMFHNWGILINTQSGSLGSMQMSYGCTALQDAALFSMLVCIVRMKLKLTFLKCHD
ncbi:hypothetical protein BJ741DRAFT_639381 [Chytriomyces cf. hyalinus JEL632]|nr:hypothetical protein BJ741DRAFT_639381 [Chytriomyces cf. hyalinus JEL632]